VKLKLVNRELEAIFDELYDDWFRNTLGSTGTQRLVKAVLEGDVPTFQLQLGADLAEIYLLYGRCRPRRRSTSTKGLMLGLDGAVPRRVTRSCRTWKWAWGERISSSSRRGPVEAGVVMELKVVQQPQALLEGVVEALQQLGEKHYETLLERPRGHQASPLWAGV
jgi:hypothetical protein